jgi:hypothetical protein
MHEETRNKTDAGKQTAQVENFTPRYEELRRSADITKRENELLCKRFAYTPQLQSTSD